MKIVFNLMLLIFIIQSAFAQSDKDVDEKDVPSAMREYLTKNYKDAEDIEYYQTIENDSTFFETEFKSKGNEYNLRFFPDGSLYEIEMNIDFEDLPSTVKDNINKDLSCRFSKFKIKESQEVNPNKELKYEISIRGKKRRHSGYFELFYDRNGNFISEKEKVLKSILNNSGF